MYKDKVIAAVVPAYNEEAHIVNVIESMPEFVDHIIVVNDCSTDKTSSKASEVVDPRLTVISHEVNQGVGGAIITGYKHAIAQASDITVVMAGDGQMDPQYLPSLLDPIVSDIADVTKGNRFYSTFSFEGMPRARVFGNIVLSILTKGASGYWHMFDPQNGYVASKVSTLLEIPLDSVVRGYAFENDMLVHLNIVNARVKDVSIPANYGSEVSTLKIGRDGWKILIALTRGFFKRIIWKYVVKSLSPVAILLAIGSFGVLIGLIFGIWIAIASISTTPTAATVMLAMFPFLAGLQMLLFAMLLDIGEEPK